jgi:glycerol kinase
MSLLAVRAGTTAVTAVVVSTQGRVVATASRALPQHSPRPGWTELAPEEIWQATLGATREVLGTVDASDLTAIGVTNERDALVLWDRETLGSPRPAIAPQDRRTAALCERLRADGRAGRVAELTGQRLGPGLPGPGLAWLAEHEPHTWALVESGRYAVGTVDSYLVARMTRGTWHLTDVANAGRTLLMDLTSGDWSDELCGLFGVPRDALPELVSSWGEVATSEPRAFLGLGLPVAGVAADHAAALVGQACLEPGDTACTPEPGGSVRVITATGATIERSEAGLLTTLLWRSPGGEPAYALEGTAAAPGEVGATVRDLRGTVALAPRLRVGGAAAADDALCQQLADGTRLPVERPVVLDTATLGAALLAGLGTGVWESADALREVWALDRRFDPAASPGVTP